LQTCFTTIQQEIQELILPIHSESVLTGKRISVQTVRNVKDVQKEILKESNAIFDVNLLPRNRKMTEDLQRLTKQLEKENNRL
jgi:hypothetical protein